MTTRSTHGDRPAGRRARHPRPSRRHRRRRGGRPPSPALWPPTTPSRRPSTARSPVQPRLEPRARCVRRGRRRGTGPRRLRPGRRGRLMAADVAYLCRALKAPSLAAAVDRLAERARADGWSHEEFLAACSSVKSPPERPTAASCASAPPASPARKSLDEFDFDHQRSLKREVTRGGFERVVPVLGHVLRGVQDQLADFTAGQRSRRFRRRRS